MPVGVQCPISSSLGEFPSYWDWLWCPGLLPVLVSIAFPFAYHTWCFPFALIYHWISIMFLLYGRRIATLSVDPSLTRILGEFPGLGLVHCKTLKITAKQLLPLTLSCFASSKVVKYSKYNYTKVK